MKNDLIEKLKINNIFLDKDLSQNVLFDFVFKNCKTLEAETIPYEEGNFYGALFQLYEVIDENIQNILEKVESELLNKDSLRTSLSNHIYVYIINHLISKVLLSEKKLAIEYLLKNSEDFDRDFICEVSNNEEWIYYFFEKYPLTFFLISNFLEKQFIYAQSVLENVIKDHKQLQSEFLIQGTLNEIHIAQGDLHNKNKSVCKLFFENGIIYYKPRSFEPEILVNSIINKNDLIIRIPKFLDKKEYGYSENIINRCQEEKSFKRTTDYFYEIGRALKMFTRFQFEDIINENVIYSNGFLYLIDLECVFIPKIFSLENRLIDHSKILSLSPIGTAAIPYKQGIYEYPYSILLPSRKTVNNNSKTKLNSNTFIFERDENDSHLPEYYFINDKYEYVICVNKLIQGYSHPIIEDNINEEIENTPTRLIVRETMKYFELQMHVKSPEFLTNSDEYYKQFAVILPKSDEEENSRVIKQSEHSQLLEGDIPAFYLKNGHLLNGNKDCIIENYYTKQHRIQNTNSNIKFEKLIHDAMILQLPDIDIFDYYFSKIKNKNINCPDLDDIYSQIAQFLEDRVFAINGQNYLLNGYVDPEKLNINNVFVSNLSLLKPGLYDGSDGLVLSYFSAFHKKNKFISTSFDLIINQNINSFKDALKKEISDELSVFKFPNSTIVTTFLKFKSTKDSKEFNEICDLFLSNFLAGIKKKESLINYSFTEGISSTLLFINNNITFFSKNLITEIYILIGQFLLEDIRITNEKFEKGSLLDWNLSSSKSGKMICLKILSNYFKSEEIYTLEFQKFEDNFIDDFLNDNLSNSILNTNQSWLTGLNGTMALGLTVENEKLNPLFVKYYTERTNNYKLSSFSLSGGVFGSLHIMKIIEDRKIVNQSSLKNKISFDSLFNLNGNEILKTMLPLGMYNGISGFFHINYNNNFDILIPSEKWLKF